MKLPYFIASRYLFSKKKHNVINIISLVSVVGVAIGTMAVVIVLSVFNGMDDMVRKNISPISADIKIAPIEGKSFLIDSLTYQKLIAIEGVKDISEVVEETSIVKYEKRQQPVVLKGISESFVKARGIESKLFDGEFYFKRDGFNYVVPGYGVARDLGVGLSFISTLDFYFPKRGTTDLSNPLNALKTAHAFPAGIFDMQTDINSKYVFTSVEFAQKLMGLGDRITAVEISLRGNQDKELLKEQIQAIVGDTFSVKNQYEQNETLFKMMESEKVAIFFILIFIILIASFNIVGSLTMLIIDKREDINTLSYMGMQKNDLQKIFWYEGWMISIVGALMGIVIGVVVCLMQQQYEILTIGSAEMPYPISIESTDIYIILGSVLLIGYIAARYPVQYLIKRLT